MGVALDLTGQVFGRLTVTGSRSSIYGVSFWECTCTCGVVKPVRTYNLKAGITKSCSCLRNEPSPNRTHGMSRTKEGYIWSSMKSRCNNKNSRMYHAYGGRGIQVCERWQASFEAFYADVGPRPSPKHSLDRIDNDGPYCPENCRWVTQKEQNNNRQYHVYITCYGKTLNEGQWAERLGLPRTTIQRRRGLGYCGECILAPCRKMRFYGGPYCVRLLESYTEEERRCLSNAY